MNPRASTTGAPAAWLPWAGAAIAALLWFGTIGFRDLVHPDEGRYAEIGRAMLAGGDWVTPRLNGILYFEKPPLQYWATAAAFALLGVGEAGARLWPALTGALGVAALWWFARREFGPRIAAHCSCVLGGSVWWIANSHFVNLDAGLAAFMSLALLGFGFAQRDAATDADNRRGMLVAWAAMGLAVLSKGLVGIVLPGAALVAYSLLARDFAPWRRMRWLSGTALMLAIAAPWFVWVSMRNPEFARFFFIHEHFERFTTTGHRRTGPWWYFLPVLAAGLLPWTTLLPGALAAGWKRRPGGFQAGRLLVAWAAVIFVFFSASGSKLPSYILPIFPALALLIGPRLAMLPARRFAGHAAAIAVLCVLAAAALLAAPQMIHRSTQDAAVIAYRNWLLPACGILGAAGALAAWLALREEAVGATARMATRTTAVAVLALGSLGATTTGMLAHQVFASAKSAHAMVESIRGRIDPAAPFYSVGTYDQTLPFYLGRPVTLVAWIDEFATGIRIEPERQVPTLEQFDRLWRARPGAVAMMRIERHAAFEREGLPMTEIHRDANRVVVVSP